MESNPHRRPHPHTLQCRLVMADGGPATVLMVGGLKSLFSLNASCSMILILRLNLMTMESEEEEKMAPRIFRHLRESSKFKVFESEDMVCFSMEWIKKKLTLFGPVREQWRRWW
ncbi:hypothetical protein AHAS_Ahas03G0163300 [Arachis hypogaea]